MTLVLGLALAPLAFAHEGHVHKVMGTVAVLHENHLEVKATDGKTATVTLNDKTKVLRGKAQTTVADIRVGERVVVTAAQTKGKDGKTSLIAKQINLSTASTNPR
jgi:hypothetical protein